MKDKIKIDNKYIGKDQPMYFIAEAGVNHNNSLEIAFKLVDAAVSAKADAVKFQTFKAKNIALKNAPKANYHIETTGSDKVESWYDMLERQELSLEYHYKILEYCNKNNITFLSTPYDLESVDLLEKVGVKAYKVASTDNQNFILLDYLIKKNKPIIVSTAMCYEEEVDDLYEHFKENNFDELVIMHCTGNYPSDLNESNLLVLKSYLNKYDCIIGYSDHNLDIINPIASTAMGAKVYEKHITIDKSLEGPDHRASLTPEELKQTILNIRKTEISLGNHIKSCTPSELNNRDKLKKSIYLSKEINVNEIFEIGHLCAKRPAHGMSPQKYRKIIGKKSLKNLKVDHLLSEKDYE